MGANPAPAPVTTDVGSVLLTEGPTVGARAAWEVFENEVDKDVEETRAGELLVRFCAWARLAKMASVGADNERNLIFILFLVPKVVDIGLNKNYVKKKKSPCS